VALKLEPGTIYNGLKEISAVMERTEKSLKRLARRDGFPLFADSGGRLWTSSDAILEWVRDRARAPFGRPQRQTPPERPSPR